MQQRCLGGCLSVGLRLGITYEDLIMIKEEHIPNQSTFTQPRIRACHHKGNVLSQIATWLKKTYTV